MGDAEILENIKFFSDEMHTGFDDIQKAAKIHHRLVKSSRIPGDRVIQFKYWDVGSLSVKKYCKKGGGDVEISWRKYILTDFCQGAWNKSAITTESTSVLRQ